MRNRSNEQDFLCQMLDVINWVEAVLCFLSSKRQSSLDLTIFSLYQRINFLFIKTPCWRQIVHKMSNLCHESRGITQLWASSWNYTKSTILPWVFFTFLNFTNRASIPSLQKSIPYSISSMQNELIQHVELIIGFSDGFDGDFLFTNRIKLNMIFSSMLYSCAFCEPLTSITLIFKPFVLSGIEIIKYKVCNNTSVFASNNIENFVFLPTKLLSQPGLLILTVSLYFFSSQFSHMNVLLFLGIYIIWMLLSIPQKSKLSFFITK